MSPRQSQEQVLIVKISYNHSDITGLFPTKGFNKALGWTYIFKKITVLALALTRMLTYCTITYLLNQARAGRRPARTRFLKIDPVRIVSMHMCVCVYVCVCVCVCVSDPEAINN